MGKVSEDYHIHSTYSDGFMLPVMAELAQKTGLEGIGVADHCIVSDRDEERITRTMNGFNLDKTYERRKQAIEMLRRDMDIAIYDAAEIDYHQKDEATISDFLDKADFDYTIGSVHRIKGVDVQNESYFADTSESERAMFVDEYFKQLVALIDSELFEIVSHPDLFERNQYLRNLGRLEHYVRVAKALEQSDTIAEVNAGRVEGEYGNFHPRPQFFDILQEYELEFTTGTDAHWRGSFEPRITALRTIVEERNFEPVSPLD